MRVPIPATARQRLKACLVVVACIAFALGVYAGTVAARTYYGVADARASR